MPKLFKLATAIAAVALLLAILGPLTPGAATSPTGAAEPAALAAQQDDEVVLILNTGYIKVEDPFTAAGHEPATWTSPQGGWSFVTTGDFNGDGDDEIVALGGSRAKIYDPFPEGGTPVDFDVSIGSHSWYNAAAGDIDLDGRDELLLLRDDNNTSANIYCHLVVYDGNADGTQWSVVQDLSYGTTWKDLATGNFIGDQRDEVVLLRQQVPTTEGLSLVMNAQTGQMITQDEFGYFFERVATGDVNADGHDEFAAVRSVIAPFSNAVIFRVKGVNLGLETLATQASGSPFMWVTMGDYDADGADEVGLLRNVPSPHKGIFGMDLHAPVIDLNEVIAEGWTDIQSGDINADGKDEVLILKSSLVRAYRVTPSAAITWTKSGSYKSVFATGDIDGAGIVHGPLLAVSPTSLSFEMDFGGGAPAAQQVDVTNEGSDTINWTATKTSGANWLVVSPTSGTAPGSFQVSINTAVVSPGNYSADITVDGGAGVENSPQTVTVSLEVTGPVLNVTPPSLSFTMDYGNPAPPSKVLTLSNSAGTGPINWTATVEPDEGWLTVTPTSGSTPGTMEVSIVAELVQAGTHMVNIIIDGGPDAGNSPFSVPVTLFVQAPTMEVSPNTVTIMSDPGAVIPQQIVRVTQEGGGSGAIQWVATIIFKDQWEALKARGDVVKKVYATETGLDAVVDGEAVHIDSVDWLTIFPTSGTTPTDVHLALDSTGLALGTYQATVIVDGGAGVIDRLGWCDVTLMLMEPMAFLPQVMKVK